MRRKHTLASSFEVEVEEGEQAYPYFVRALREHAAFIEQAELAAEMMPGTQGLGERGMQTDSLGTKIRWEQRSVEVPG